MMHSVAPRAQAHVSLSALAHNLGRVRHYAPNARVMAAVKSNAYGHGAVPVAKALAAAGCDALAVADLEEGVALRQHDIRTPIVVLNGVVDVPSLQRALQARLQVVVHDETQLQLLEAQHLHDDLPVWMKLDTGMHRLGFQPQDVPAVRKRLQHAGIEVAGWMTHLACADERDNDFTAEQIAVFNQAVQGQPGQHSIANSAGVVAWPTSHADWVRPGIMLYGGAPLVGGHPDEHDLRPVMRFSTRLVTQRSIPAGAAVGYGLTWRAPTTLRMGVAAIGYGDGYPRHAGNTACVLINGQRAAVIGRVSMDLLILDLSQCPDAQVGDEVLLWGTPALTADEIAAAAGTISYELFCRLTRRVQFVYAP